jgi:hypothetical protein
MLGNSGESSGMRCTLWPTPGHWAEVRLEALPLDGNVTARVVNCISMGAYEKLWLLGLALNEPGNVWGIQSPPNDWYQ